MVKTIIAAFFVLFFLVFLAISTYFFIKSCEIHKNTECDIEGLIIESEDINCWYDECERNKLTAYIMGFFSIFALFFFIVGIFEK